MNLPPRPFPRRRSTLSLAGLLALVSASAFPVRAQTAPAPRPAGDAPVELAPFSVVADPTGYQVSTSTTGTRLNTALKDVPQSLTILTKDFLEDTGATTLEDAVTFVANVQPRQNLADGLLIRGLQTTRKYYNNYLVPGFVAGLANVSRIEILKGPASAIYGRGELGGVVNYVSLQPTAQPRRTLRLSAGSYDRYEAKVDATGPVPGVRGLSYRLSGNYLEAGEVIDFARTQQHGIFPSLKYQLGRATEIAYDGVFFRGLSPGNEGTPFLSSRTAGGPAGMPEVFAPRSLNTSGSANGNSWDRREFDVRMHFVTVTHAFGRGLFLRQGFADYDREQQIAKVAVSNIMRRVPATGEIFLARAPNRTRERETGRIAQGDVALKLHLPRPSLLASHHETLAGYEYQKSDRDNQRWPGTLGDLSVYAPNYSLAVTERAQDTDTTNQRTAYGYFAHHVSKFARDRIQLSASVRWDDENTEARNLRTNGRSQTDPKSTRAPRYGAAVRVLDPLTVYALRSEQSDPVMSTRVWTGLPGTHPRFDERFSSQVIGRIDEAGFKGEFFDRKLSVTFSYFKMFRDGLTRPSVLTPQEYALLGIPFGAAGYGRNLLVKGEESRGWELEWFGQVTQRLAIFGGYGDLRTEAETNGVRGPTRGVPEFKLTTFAKYDFRSAQRTGWEARLGVAAIGPQYANQNTDLGARHGTSVRYDLGATYDWKKYSLSLQVKNLTDTTQVISAVAVGSNRLAAPREFLVSGVMRF